MNERAMNAWVRTAAIAVMLVLPAVAAAFAAEAVTEEDPVCSGRAPSREVAQDEIYTFDELCSMRENFRTDRERSAVGWARAHGAAPNRATEDQEAD